MPTAAIPTQQAQTLAQPQQQIPAAQPAPPVELEARRSGSNPLRTSALPPPIAPAPAFSYRVEASDRAGVGIGIGGSLSAGSSPHKPPPPAQPAPEPPGGDEDDEDFAPPPLAFDPPLQTAPQVSRNLFAMVPPAQAPAQVPAAAAVMASKGATSAAPAPPAPPPPPPPPIMFAGATAQAPQQNQQQAAKAAGVPSLTDVLAGLGSVKLRPTGGSADGSPPRSHSVASRPSTADAIVGASTLMSNAGPRPGLQGGSDADANGGRVRSKSVGNDVLANLSIPETVAAMAAARREARAKTLEDLETRRSSKDSESDKAESFAAPALRRTSSEAQNSARSSLADESAPAVPVPAPAPAPKQSPPKGDKRHADTPSPVAMIFNKQQGLGRMVATSAKTPVPRPSDSPLAARPTASDTAALAAASNAPPRRDLPQIPTANPDAARGNGAAAATASSSSGAGSSGVRLLRSNSAGSADFKNRNPVEALQQKPQKQAILPPTVAAASKPETVPVPPQYSKPALQHAQAPHSPSAAPGRSSPPPSEAASAIYSPGSVRASIGAKASKPAANPVSTPAAPKAASASNKQAAAVAGSEVSTTLAGSTPAKAVVGPKTSVGKAAAAQPPPLSFEEAVKNKGPLPAIPPQSGAASGSDLRKNPIDAKGSVKTTSYTSAAVAGSAPATAPAPAKSSAQSKVAASHTPASATAAAHVSPHKASSSAHVSSPSKDTKPTLKPSKGEPSAATAAPPAVTLLQPDGSSSSSNNKPLESLEMAMASMLQNIPAAAPPVSPTTATPPDPALTDDFFARAPSPEPTAVLGLPPPLLFAVPPPPLPESPPQSQSSPLSSRQAFGGPAGARISGISLGDASTDVDADLLTPVPAVMNRRMSTDSLDISLLPPPVDFMPEELDHGELKTSPLYTNVVWVFCKKCA